jgi:hypothetical protein
MKPKPQYSAGTEARRSLFEQIEAHAGEVLRRHTCHTLSLQQLHDALVHELGPAAGTYHQLQQRLKQARAVFHVVERAGPLLEECAWPREIREQYAGALREAGLDFSPLVSLAAASPGRDTGILGGLEETLASLHTRSRTDPLLSADLMAALNELPSLLQALETAPPPTIALHGPHAEP